MCVCLCKVTIYKRSQRLSTSYILYIHSIACLPFEVMMTPYYVKGTYYALLQNLDFFWGGVLEDALILGGSKIALFFTSFALLQYLSPQPDTNGSISSGFDFHLPKNQMCCDWLAVPECCDCEQLRLRFSTAPPLPEQQICQYCHINSHPENIDQEDCAEPLHARIL